MKIGEAAMTGRTRTMALALGMVAGLARADQAKPRGSGGGGGGGSSSAGVHHHSSGGGSGSHPSSGGGGYHSPSSSRTTAEQRHPRAGTGTGYHGHYGYSYYPGYGYWYGPGYWPSYYYGYWPYYGGAYFGLGYGGSYYGGGGYYGGGYYGGDAPYYRSYASGDGGSLRLLVDPEDARVYVDGNYAGEVDDFDGMFQHLTVGPGRHEITLKKDGYRTHRIKVYAGDSSTVKIRYAMEKGTGPDTMEDLAGERGLDEERRRAESRESDAYGRARESQDRPPEPALRDDAPVDAPREETMPPVGLVTDGNAAPGVLSLNVTPADASVYVDGRFVGSARQTGELTLRPGRHRVEIVRPGYRTAERDVTIDGGRSQTLSLDLARP